MASTISVRGEPVASEPTVYDLSLLTRLNIFLHLRSENWTQWTIKAAQVKENRWPFSFKDGQWCILGRLTRLTLVCGVIICTAWFKSKKLSKRLWVGSLQFPFSTSSSFVLLFVLLPFFLEIKIQSTSYSVVTIIPKECLTRKFA